MFEDTLVESSGKVGMKKGRTVAVSALLHAGLIAVLVFLPLVFTNSIEGARLRSFLVAPPPPPASQPASNPIPSIVRHAAASSPATAVAPSTTTATIAPIEVPQDIPYIVDLLPSGPFAEGGPTGTRIGVPNGVEGLQPVPFHVVIPPPPQPPPPPTPGATPPPPLPTSRPKGPVRISEGAIAGYALFHPSPEYPPLARMTRVEGRVVLQAVITEDGDIKDLKIIAESNPLLRKGVIETVSTWKYKPTLLSGEPVEVITTITINFSLGH
jgi:protein TonB